MEGLRRRKDLVRVGGCGKGKGSCGEVAVVSRCRREEDLAECFQRRVLERLLRGRGALARRGSELERRSCGVGGDLVRRRLMPG